MSSEQPSTLKSYVDSATGYVQETYDNLVGNTSAENEAKAKQDNAKAEYDASHAATNMAGYSVSSAGAVTKNDPDRNAGSWNQTIGSAKEAIGGLIGSESLKQSGREQNLQGQQQEAKGQLNDFGSGMADRVTGTIGATVAGFTGDSAKQKEFQDQHDRGKTQQRSAEIDIQKQAEAKQQNSQQQQQQQ